MVTVQEKIQGIEKERKEALLRGFKYILVMGLISLIPIFFSWGIFIIIFIGLFAVVTGFVIYRIWAPARIFGYFVKETYCLLIIEGGAYKRADLQLTGCTLTEKGWIVPENEKDGIGDVLSKYNIEPGKRIEKRRNFFGMRFFEWLGVFEEPLIDTFSWSKNDPNSQKIIGKEDVIYDGWIVVPYNYGIEVRNILTKDGMPVGFDLTLLSELLNPVIAKFGTKNWYNSFVQDITKTIVEAIGESTYDDIQNQSKDFGAYFLKKFKEPVPEEGTPDKKMSLIERCLIKYGAHIMSIQVVKFIAPPDIVNAADEQKKEELMKKAAKTKASAVQEVVLTKAAAIDSLFITRSGLSYEDYIQEMLDPEDFKEKYGELYETCRKDVLDIMAIDKGTGIRINGGGGIVDAAAVFQTLSGSKPPSEEPKEKKEGKKGRIFDEKTREDLKKAGFPVELEDEL
ncbi:MAG: SPFH domain-containing protein [Minisyncoccales bacterium]